MNPAGANYFQESTATHLRAGRPARILYLMTSKEMLLAAGYDSMANKYACRCDACGAGHAPGAGRVMRLRGGQNWIPGCRSVACTRAILRSGGVVMGEADGNPTEAQS